jgi:hypothetical protein
MRSLTTIARVELSGDILGVDERPGGSVQFPLLFVFRLIRHPTSQVLQID